MNLILRSFFYAIGFTMMFVLYGLDADTGQFGDFVRAVQSPLALKVVLALTGLILGLELLATTHRNSRVRWAVLDGASGANAGCTTSVLHKRPAYPSPRVDLGDNYNTMVLGHPEHAMKFKYRPSDSRKD